MEAPIITLRRFPLEIVFRIYDGCLANGIEAIFGFSVALLKRNEEALLALKFDQILAFLSNRLLDIYKVCVFVSRIGISTKSKVQSGEGKDITYDADRFVQDAVSLQITSFMLDSYRHEYEDFVVSTVITRNVGPDAVAACKQQTCP